MLFRSIKRYQKIISNKEAILNDARQKAETLINDATVHTNELINEHEIMQQAYSQANDIVSLATQQAQEILDNAMLEANGEKLAGKTVAVSGFGNVAWGTVQKLEQLGATVVTISGPDGYIYDPDGVKGEKVDYMLDLRSSGKNVCAPYAEKFEGSTFVAGKKPWEVKADIYIPCATQNEILIEDAKMIVEHGSKFMCEGSNMSSTNEAIKYLQDNGVIVGPSKAANAGGVACSCIEMGQNAGKTVYSPEEVYAQLETIMIGIHDACANSSHTYGFGYNLVAGANIAGFLKVADAMMCQGLV